ncbi:hypothetical protein WR25_00570 isoform C [Diploscapter pachys]|uniref:Major facilitator superfamily (MFS) profile domain-containing protein n=2 Tax=Diploscapter pachys TaxID=2018661 RepID=A0A2A2JK46_9BILA|nr:hypothetical protein WR25_00570 isoform C [Diploscapter pachys]
MPKEEMVPDEKEKLQIEDTEKEDVKELIESGSNSDNDNDDDNEAPILEPDEVVLEPVPAETHKNAATLSDFAQLGPYLYLILIVIECSTLTSLSSMVYMVYAGYKPSLIPSCNLSQYNNFTSPNGCNLLGLYRNESTACRPSLSYQFYSVNVEFNMLCEDGKAVKNSITYQMVGVLIGAFVFGQISDMFGRKRVRKIRVHQKFTSFFQVLIIVLLGISIFSLLTANVGNFVQFLMTRIAVGFFTGGLSAVQGVFLIENIPKRHRMWVNTIVTWSPNYIFFPLIAYLCYTWRKLSLFTSGISLLACILLAFTFESPRWMIQKGRISEARNAIAKIRKINGDTNEVDAAHIEEILADEEKMYANKHKSSGKKYTFYHIVCTKTYLIWTLTLCYGVISASLINYGLLFNIETLSGSLFWNSSLYGIVRWSTNCFVGSSDYFIPKFGRKTLHLVAVVFIVVAVITISILYTIGGQNDYNLYIRYITIAVTAIASQLSLTKMMTCSELFPTAIRNVAISAVSICSRAGVALSPQLFYLADIKLILPYIVVATLCMIDLVVFQLNVPETKNKTLENHLPPKSERLFYRRKKNKSADHIALTSTSNYTS